MSHDSTYRGSYSSAFMAVVGRVLRSTPYSGATVSPHITHTNDYFRGGAALHGGIDFNYVGGQTHALNQIGVSTVYAPISGRLARALVVDQNGEPAGDGSVFIEDSNGIVHGFLHLDSFSQNLINTPVGGTITLDMPLGQMGNRNGGIRSGDVHVHYAVYLNFDPVTATGNKIDPIVYWTPALNPHAPLDAQGNPTGTGLLVYATPVTDWNQNGSIDTQGTLSESSGFVREGQSSILKLGVNTPHTQPLTLRIDFSERPQGLDASLLDGVDSLSWDGNTLLVTLSATVNQATPNTAGHILLQFAEESDSTNTRSETITYSVSVDGPAGAVFGSAPAQSLFLIDNDTPLAPGDILDPPPYDPDTQWLTNGTDQNNNTSIAGVGPGHPDFIDFDGDGTNDNRAIQGTANADRIHGNEGDDDIFGHDGGDFLYGNKGKTVFGSEWFHREAA